MQTEICGNVNNRGETNKSIKINISRSPTQPKPIYAVNIAQWRLNHNAEDSFVNSENMHI